MPTCAACRCGEPWPGLFVCGSCAGKPDGLEERQILRKASAILKREKQHNSSQTCLTIADRLEREQ